MKTPQRLFFLMALICLMMGFLLQFLVPGLGYSLLKSRGKLPSLNGKKLVLAKYYFDTGQPEKSVSEVTKQIASLSAIDATTAQEDLGRILSLYQNPDGQVGFLILQISSNWPSKLYVAFLILIACCIGTLIYGRLIKRHLFAVMPFTNYSGLNIGEELPATVLDRVHEIAWQSKNLRYASKLIAENLDIPTMGMSTDQGTFDTTAFLETALLFSMGISDFPLARLINSIKLWFEQPNYLVRGSFETIQNRLLITIQLIDNRKGKTVQVWNYEMAESKYRRHSEIVDIVLYPLYFHFSTNLEATHWETLYALHAGIEEFQNYLYHRSQIHHLGLAEDYLEKAIELDPSYGLAHYNLGLLYLISGDYEKACELLRDAPKLTQNTELARWSTYNYGVALFQISQDWANQRAANVFEGIISSKDTTDSLKMMTHASLAATYAKMAGRLTNRKQELTHKAFDEADSVLQAQGLQDAKAIAWTAKGYAYLALDQLDNAQIMFEEGHRTDMRNITCLIGLGEVFYRYRKTDEALSALKQATILSPRGGYAHYRIGKLYWEMKDYKRAVEAYQQASNLSVARLALGKIFLEDGLLTEALEEFRATAHLNSHSADAWENIAWTILELNDEALMAEAELAARRSVQLEKNDSLLWHRHAVLSRCLLKRNKNEPALREALLAVRLAPERAQAHYVLALCQMQIGRKDDAKSTLSRVIELDKKGFWRSEAQRTLKEINE